MGATALLDALRAETGGLRSASAGGRRRGDRRRGDRRDRERARKARLRAAMRPSLVRVINATGVIVHTNLGRAPLSAAALARVTDVAGGYANLEYDLARGARGRRDIHAEKLIARLTGAEAASSSTTTPPRPCWCSRRWRRARSDHLARRAGRDRRRLPRPGRDGQSGAVLREVGTTNRTRAADYAAAISERTALILRVHPSNFRIVGFTERPALEGAGRARTAFKIPVAEDLGSGWLGWPERERNLPGAARRTGRFREHRGGRGRRLLQRRQAARRTAGRDHRGPARDRGLIRHHPLMRALRVDKLTYAALEATLEEHAIGRAARASRCSACWATREEIGRRADALGGALNTAAGPPRHRRGVDRRRRKRPGAEIPTRLVELVSRLTADQSSSTCARSIRPSSRAYRTTVWFST